MAGNYLSSRGVNLDEVMSKIQFAESEPREAQDRGPLPVSRVTNARLPRQPVSTFWDLAIERGRIASLSPHDEAGPDLKGLPGVLDACGRLLAPSLCHAHIHLDKCFLLQDPKFIDLEIVQGDFGEAMSLTSHAKSRFEEDDLLRRGRRLIEESIEAGVTAMRAFVEVDTIVEMKCVDAGLQLKNEFEGRCDVQICVFAQLPLFSGEDDGDANRALMTRGLGKDGVDAVGSTPYVESSEEKQLQNIRWTIERAMQHRKHLDFHLDYNLEIKTAADAKIWYVVDKIKDEGWREQTVTCGHCTALTLLDDQELRELRRATEECPISFVGLPTSDLFMMDRPEAPDMGAKDRGREERSRSWTCYTTASTLRLESTTLATRLRLGEIAIR